MPCQVSKVTRRRTAPHGDHRDRHEEQRAQGGLDQARQGEHTHDGGKQVLLPCGSPRLHGCGCVREDEDQEDAAACGVPAGEDVAADAAFEHRCPGHEDDHDDGEVARQQTGYVGEERGVEGDRAGASTRASPA